MTTWDVVCGLRRTVLAQIDAAVDEAIGELERWEAVVIGLPHEGGGEWDWYRDVTLPERVRLRRWTSRDGDGPDVVAGRVGRDVDDVMGEWLRLTRIVDAGLSVHRRKSGAGYVPPTGPFGGQGLDDLFPSEYGLAELFASQPTCTAYVEGLEEPEEWGPDDTLAYMTSALSSGALQ